MNADDDPTDNLIERAITEIAEQYLERLRSPDVTGRVIDMRTVALGVVVFPDGSVKTVFNVPREEAVRALRTIAAGIAWEPGINPPADRIREYLNRLATAGQADLELLAEVDGVPLNRADVIDALNELDCAQMDLLNREAAELGRCEHPRSSIQTIAGNRYVICSNCDASISMLAQPTPEVPDGH